MSSGRRETVMIFCATPLSRLYLAPLGHYRPDTVHAFIPNRDDAVSSVSREVFSSSKKDIGSCDIIEHSIDTSDYNSVLGEIIEITTSLQKEYEDDLDIFINITSGTPEFAAAGMFASMLPLSVTAFKIDVDCSMSPEELSKIMGGINDSLDISSFERVTCLKNDVPDDEMISFLTVVRDLLKVTKYPKERDIINALKKADAWSYDPYKKDSRGRTTLEEKEERYLERNYMTKALENGWLEKPSPRTMRLTRSGEAYIGVYATRISNDRACASRCRMDEYEPVKMYSCSRCDMPSYDEEPYLDFDEPSDRSNTITIGHGGKRYRFTIGMDRNS